VFDISLGVLRGNGALRAELDAALLRHRGEIDQVLRDYDVPRVDR
jgi:mxaJ protein